MVYDAKECNAVSARFSPQPERDEALRSDCFVRLLAKGIHHSLRRLSRIPSRKAAVALAGICSEILDLLEYELLPNGQAIRVTIPGFYLGYGKAVPSGDVE